MRYSKSRLVQRCRVLLTAALLIPGLVATADAAVPSLELVAQPDDSSAKLPAVALEAPGVGASASKLLFLRQKGKTALTGVQLFTDVTNPQVTIAAEGAQNNKVTVPAGGAAVRVTFTVSGVGHQPSTKGKIFADVGGQIQTVAALAVRNRSNPSSVTFDPPATAAGVIGFGKKEGVDTEGVDVCLSAKAGGRESTFTSLTLVNFALKWKTTKVQGVYDNVEFKDSGGSVVPPLGFKRNQTTPFRVTIKGIEAPGEYDGTVRLSAPDLEAVETPISVMLRYPWTVAALLIVLGVIAAQQLRWWLVVRRTQLVAQGHVAGLREELDRLVADLTQVSALTPDENEVVEELHRRLRDLFAEAGNGEDVATEAGSIEIKLTVLSRWIRLRQKIEAAGGGQALLDELLPVGQWLLHPGGTAAEQANQLQALDATEQKLRAARTARKAGTAAAGPGEAPEASAPSSNKLRWRLRLGEAFVTLILLAIAIASGLEVLYFDSLAWGVPHDILVAVLWGLGLYAVGGGAASGGISGLRAKFSGE